jgi:putative FmdB family regulatory protein
MPIYEYECEACQSRHEIMQKFSDSPLKKCPDCGKSKLKKLMSLNSFALKGTGYYTTDYKRAGQAAAESTSAKPAEKPVEKKDSGGTKKSE